jgi:hypothetical protein
MGTCGVGQQKGVVWVLMAWVLVDSMLAAINL